MAIASSSSCCCCCDEGTDQTARNIEHRCQSLVEKDAHETVRSPTNSGKLLAMTRLVRNMRTFFTEHNYGSVVYAVSRHKGHLFDIGKLKNSATTVL